MTTANCAPSRSGNSTSNIVSANLAELALDLAVGRVHLDGVEHRRVDERGDARTPFLGIAQFDPIPAVLAGFGPLTRLRRSDHRQPLHGDQLEAFSGAPNRQPERATRDFGIRTDWLVDLCHTVSCCGICKGRERQGARQKPSLSGSLKRYRHRDDHGSAGNGPAGGLDLELARSGSLSQ